MVLITSSETARILNCTDISVVTYSVVWEFALYPAVTGSLLYHMKRNFALLEMGSDPILATSSLFTRARIHVL